MLSIPLGWLAYRFRLTRGLILTVTGLLYTIPSLALLIDPADGAGHPDRERDEPHHRPHDLRGRDPGAVGGGCAGAAIDPDVRLSATADRLRRMAAGSGASSSRSPVPVVLAGLRVAAVSTVGLVTVGILVGIQSLGLPVHERVPARRSWPRC